MNEPPGKYDWLDDPDNDDDDPPGRFDYDDDFSLDEGLDDDD